MKLIELFKETINTYHKHGWQLRRVLLRPETREELKLAEELPFEDATLDESALDALWFARAGQGGREAWELRLVASAPYALLYTFEADEAEEDREDVRREMEARLRDYARRA